MAAVTLVKHTLGTRLGGPPGQHHMSTNPMSRAGGEPQGRNQQAFQPAWGLGLSSRVQGARRWGSQQEARPGQVEAAAQGPPHPCHTEQPHQGWPPPAHAEQVGPGTAPQQ